MGQGGYIFCEWDSVQKDDPSFQKVFKKLEDDLTYKCNSEWAPKTMGRLTPAAGQYGRTSILPGLFDPNPLTYGGAAFGAAATGNWPRPPAYWRQAFRTTGAQTLIQGNGTGEGLPEDWKVGFLGLAFPNKNQHITEIRMQIGDRKYGRINLEEMRLYNKPALIFEEPFVIDEETSFHLYGFFEGPIAGFPELTGTPIQSFTPSLLVDNTQTAVQYQRIVMLGEAMYKTIDRALGNGGVTILDVLHNLRIREGESQLPRVQSDDGGAVDSAEGAVRR